MIYTTLIMVYTNHNNPPLKSILSSPCTCILSILHPGLESILYAIRIIDMFEKVQRRIYHKINTPISYII